MTTQSGPDVPAAVGVPAARTGAEPTGPTEPTDSTARTTPAGVAAAGPAPANRRRALRLALSALVPIVLVVGVFTFFLPQFTDLSTVWRSIRELSGAQLALLAGATVWNLCTYWLVMVATMPGLTVGQAVVATESSTAVANTLPGGSAIGIALNYSMYSSWGFSRSRSSVSLLVAGVWNNFAKLGMPVIALVVLALQGHVSGPRIVAAALGSAGLAGAVLVFALVLRSEDWARRTGNRFAAVAGRVRALLGRGPVTGWDHALVTFRARTVGLVRARWARITLLTLVSHASLFLLLLLAVRGMGIPERTVGWAEVLALFSFARLVTAIPLTPGGLGVVELTLITGLAAAGGPRAQAAAAVLVFRVLTYVLRIPLGLATYVFWRVNRSWRRAPGTAPRPAAVADGP